MKTLSALTRRLFAEGESNAADFKRTPDGVSADDLVSFANSATGGQILIGLPIRSANTAVRPGIRNLSGRVASSRVETISTNR
jgi:hypothetical protein